MDNENVKQWTISHFSENEENFIDDIVHETLIDAGFNPEGFSYELKISFVEPESE